MDVGIVFPSPRAAEYKGEAEKNVLAIPASQETALQF